MVLTSSQICSMLFREVGNGFYKCTTCDKQYKEGNGYTNLLNHLRRNHDDYEQEAEEASRRQNPLRLHLVVKEYPALKSRLGATTQIVNNPHLEQGLVKLQRGEALTIAERSACAGFRSTALERAPVQEDGNSSIVKAAFKKKKAPKRSHYVDVAIAFSGALLTGSPLTSSASRQNRAFGAFCEMGVAKVIDSWGLASSVSPTTIALLDKLLSLTPSQRPTSDELIELFVDCDN
ncbi:hypothetical protein PF003_g29482 [Phytophthora fragariae]|nr:hypothetical protein PF003_g29482 [Phytophthora fragariae]